MRFSTIVVVLVAACDNPPPTSAPAVVVSPVDAAPLPPPAPPNTKPREPAPTCLAKDATLIDVKFVANGSLLACYVNGTDDECWRLDPSTSAWTFASRHGHVETPAPPPAVTVTATDAKVCASDCKTIPLSGVVTSPDDNLAGATNHDRSILAVWAAGPVHVFAASGKRLTTIRPWQTPMTGGNGPSFFRQAHVLGSTIEVRIADTPITSAIRLYDVHGKKIADVFRGQPMDDTVAPLALGGSRYAFVSFDTPRSIVIVDVATGKQLASYRLPGDPLTSRLLRADDNVVWMIGPQLVRIDLATKKLATFPAPTCK